MSGFVAKWNAGDKPIDPAEIAAFVASQKHRGAKGSSHWLGGHVLIVSHLSTEPGDEFYAGKFEGGEDLVVAIDGCIDNHAELAADVGVDESAGAAQLVAQAYALWKENAFARILGPVSFVLWDGKEQVLCCVHDVVGEKPVYYHKQPGRTFVCASEICGVLADSAVPDIVNEAYLSTYLLHGYADSTATVYASIKKMSASHWFQVSHRELPQRRYFEFNVHDVLEYSTDREYADHFEQLFTKVVQSQIPADTAFAAELSGGVDSSFLTGILGGLRRDGRLSRPLVTVSQVFPGMQCDESAFIRDVVDQWDAQSLVASPMEHPVFDFVDQARRHRDLPYIAQYATAVASHNLARSSGCEIITSGFGSDELFEGSASHWRDVMQSGRWWELFARRKDYGQPERGLARASLKSLVPTQIAEAIRSRKSHTISNNSPYLQPAVFDVAGDAQAQQKTASVDAFRDFAQQSILHTLISPSFVNVLALLDRMASYCDARLRHPFLDRRVVAFALAIPENQRWRGDQRKFVVREAGRSMIPQSVLARETKTVFPDIQCAAILSALENREPTFPALSQRGWIRNDALATRIKSMKEMYERSDRGYTDETWSLWRIVSVELFLNSLID